MKFKNNIYLLILTILGFCSCNTYLDNVSLPIDKVPSEEIFSSENMIASAVTGILIETKEPNQILANTDFITALYTDVLKITASFAAILPYYKNTIQPNNIPFWAKYYKTIFNANAAIEGITKTSALLRYKNQWLGECYFARAYSYFHLVNFYGAVPLALTTDYSVNNSLSRAPIEEVYKQIIDDLKLAKELLPEEYKNGAGQNTQNRYRPNKATASALLARVYLYASQWENAELEATLVIENSNYTLEPMENVFVNGNKEIILTFANTTPRIPFAFSRYNGNMPATLTATQTTGSFGIYVAMSDALYACFETNDLRKSNWIRESTAVANASRPQTTYYFPNKYKTAVMDSGLEISLRLAEQYLIRSEARAKLQFANAKDDLNTVRQRAGLPAIDPTDILAAIAKERQTELFTEGAHRFFDLKRTGKIDEVMKIAAQAKETVWESYMAFFPIPTEDIIQNPNIVPNPGYIQ